MALNFIFCADAYDTISLSGKSKFEWLQQNLPFEKVIPSDGLPERIFAALGSGQFTRCFTTRITSVAEPIHVKSLRVTGNESGKQK